jgi:DHA2 family multidrug resistance protein
MAETEGNRALAFDWLGFAALSVAIGALQLLLDRGEQLGWFDSNEIVVMAIVSAVAFYFFVAHSLTTEQPFISIEIFRDRNFIIGLLFMFVCGVLLVASMVLMAPMLQGMMGYPIIDAGLLLGTRGAGMGVSMLMAGRLMTLVDPRILLFLGLSCCVVSLDYSIDFTPDTATHTIVWVSMLQGFGLGLMFVPLNMIGLARVPVALRTQGTAMWTLIRNLGSSIGVSIVIANLTNKTIMMHARLAESVTPFNQAMADPAAAMLDPTTDTGRALLENLITQQATIIAYANDFKLMLGMTLLAFPLILLLRTSRHQFAASR